MMGLPVLIFIGLVILNTSLDVVVGQFYQPEYIPLQRASYFQAAQPNPFFLQARHMGRTRRNEFNEDEIFASPVGKRHGPQEAVGRVSRSDSSEEDSEEDGEGRLLSPSAFTRISETLGALNTVGHFIMDITRGQDSSSGSDKTSSQVPDAILTLTTNVLGQNVSKTIEPLIKRVGHLEDQSQSESVTTDLTKKKKINKIRKDTRIYTTTPSTPPTTSIAPVPVSLGDVSGKEGENRCTTPDGRPGRCEDLSSCPSLLLDLGGLRESLCFKSLFVPGVCCPTGQAAQSTILTTQRPQSLTLRPVPRPTSPPNLVLLPHISPRPTTSRPFSPSLTSPDNSLPPEFLNTVDADDCGQQEYTTGRIVGGIESPNGQWPWMAAIFLHGPKRTEFWCGGSLIGSKYVLTAAHCTRDSRQKPFAARQFTVRLGDIDLSTDTEPSAPVTFNVKEVRAHERFSRIGFYNDVAILVLDRPVRKSKYVIPVCLPKPEITPPKERLAGRRATVVGWGTTYHGGKESTVQRQADLPIWRNEDCDRAYFQPITDNFLCAGYSEGGVDACQGDSGGPLMMRINAKWVQLGVVSFGNKCGEPGYPGVYTRISEYIEWIKDHTKD